MKDSLAGVPLRARTRVQTPAGPMTALATADGLAALVFDTDRHHPGPFDPIPVDDQDEHLQAASRWLQAYWRGEDPPPQQVRLDLHGTPFQRAAWQALLRIPRGCTWTYGELAREVAGGTSARAVGTAIGRNPVAVLVPCHRVVGADGALTGYAAGLDCKRRLLVHEGIASAAAAPGGRQPRGRPG